MSNYQLSINNYQLPEGYKQTEVGVIPEDWKVLELGEIAKLERGKFSARPRNDPKFFGGKIPFIQTGDVTQSDGKITSYSQTLNEEGLSVSKLFPKKTLFFTIAANIGDMGIASFATACPDSLIAILPRSYIDKGWIFYALRFRKGEFEDLATQNAQLNINLEKLNPYRLAVPPLSEQRAIAQTLSDVDALIAALDKLITKQRHLKTATMQQLLTGKKRLPGFGKAINNEQLTIDNDGDSATSEDNCQLSINNYQLPKGYKQTEVGVIPDDWDIKQLGQVLQIKHGKSQHEVVDPNGTYPILATGGEIGRTNTPLYSEPSVLIGRKGTIDIPYYMDTPFWTVDTLFYSEIFKNADPKFIFYKFNLIDWHSYNEASGVPSLNATTIENIDQAFPAQLEEQRAIATVLSDMDAAISALETRRAKTQAIKQGMMQELLTGKTRLINNE